MTAIQSSQGRIDALLQEPTLTKECAVEVVERYTTDYSICQSEAPIPDNVRSLSQADTTHDTPVDNETPNEANALGILQEEADAEKASFLTALKSYEAEADEKYKTGIDIHDKHTMQQVWNELDEAIKQYQEKGTKGIRGRIRGLGRKLGKHSEAVDVWLGLLPTQSQYLSVVLGGLKLIIKAASRMKSLTDEIIDALLEIPVIFDTTERARTSYGSDSLKNITGALYTSMVKALGHILEYLRRSLHRKIFKAGLQQSSFGRDLQGKIQEVKDCKNRFIAEAEMCEKEMVGRIDDRTKTTQDAVHDIQNNTNMLVELLLGNPAALDFAYELQPSPEELRQKLLSRLKYDPQSPGADVAANYTLAARLRWDDQERSLYVIRSPKLASWATSTKSTALVVHGNSRTVKRQSPLSFVCARLVHSLDQIRQKSDDPTTQKVVALHFFCGEHAGDDRKWDTPSGIVNSLLAQLLTQCKDVDLTKADSYGLFDCNKLKAVFKRFKCVLAQLPRTTTVFCVLDALSFYVTTSRRSMTRHG
ncbi:hypothetical protein BFW01_g11771 [Lasiodiplodia theobromae]|nr:hypothetical protein BFW01_g11771 [Lasiodiplodia theobromae]